jgi:cold shock CspA family protein
MTIEYGSIKKYIRRQTPEKGFGFVSRTFSNLNKKVFFNSKKINRKHPELAQKLENGKDFESVNFWYKIEIGEQGERVSDLWLNTNNIPKSYTDELCALTKRVESIWRDVSSPKPAWLDCVTIDLVGVDRRDELGNERDNLEFQYKLIEEKRCRDAEAQRKNEIRKMYERNIELRDSRSNSEELSNIYVGLPEHLSHCVLWVAREYRSNTLSHIPGGSDVVVEYHDGKALGYDWIKKPSAYIRTFFAGIIEYAPDVFEALNEQQKIEITKNKISRLFARKYKNSDKRSQASFVEVWNSETSNEMPWKSLEKFESSQRGQINWEEDYNVHTPQSVLEYYGYEPAFEHPVDKAERLCGIPDPRLVEDD